jgi:hypothetical protein
VLTINYIIGGGSLSNCNANEITRISSYQLLNDATSLNPDEQTLFNTVKQTLRVNNYTSAVGGADEESVDQIKQNAILNFTSQNRSVTKDDYFIRTYAYKYIYSIYILCLKIHVYKLCIHIRMNILYIQSNLY